MKLAKLKFNTIRSKLIISLVAICIIPLIIAGFISYNQSKSILNNKLTLTSTQTLSEINYGLLDYFHGFTNTVSMISKNPSIINIEGDNNSEVIMNVLKSVQDSDKDVMDIYYGTASGKFYTYPDNPMPSGYDATTRVWYKQALEHKGQVIITPVYQDASTGKNVVGIAQTVEKDGQVIGVLGLDCELSTLAERIAAKKIGNSGYVFVSDLSGNILAHPEKESINTDVSDKLSIWDKVKSEDSGFINYELNGVKKFGVYQTNELTGWKLVATLDESELSNDTKSILQTTLFIILVMGLISILMSLILSKGIANNIKKLKDVFAKASEGDLTVSISASTNDEFMDLVNSFNSMIENMSELMDSVTKSSKEVLETSSNLAGMSQEVTASIGEVAKAIEEVSEGATNQSQNAQSGASEMNELSDRLDKMNVNSNEMDELSNNTKDLGSKGLSMIDMLIEKSNKTKIATNEVNEIVQDMNESTKKINTISETIAEITEQTGLLSLNASIESARVGEAGKGFAVVAEEIRKLAEQSKNSTEEIKLIITSIQEKSNTAVKAIKSTESVVNEQDLAVGQTQIIFSEILDSISIMIDKVEEVKLSIVDINEKKQSTLIEIENISSISEETASASEEVTASTEEITAAMDKFVEYADGLQVLAERLGSEIDKFKIKEH
ncbi:methyl-accepting chemotaxis protein McpC [Clostridium saccharobutylicum]|uniref:methyl-accepting chemotaxis protein n=1 Tax=Clostridium saccharobutylicum TaxID=169679 RepID=UPI000983B20D|nr:methyl-accepting chemotaxis protein [Clostridium saccharobutylicum]AQS08259.1 methyl-accepting chemotaxis protein McpC [Clostridium saccharobutylicum]MBC2435855.1 HAMP domain-containing protein [Clostridium saccharobutylicum]NSB88377.1 methyl-accepting chemotaxis protein [Clostridium saccharobutylicum]NYC29415.1 methyl-accepting chemotaxis protein [Clostridium saccharobutylicum]OOM10943.1 methyl-accepting chemotaxis protein McpC [Clostridium saccharobutylicum]